MKIIIELRFEKLIIITTLASFFFFKLGRDASSAPPVL